MLILADFWQNPLANSGLLYKPFAHYLSHFTPFPALYPFYTHVLASRQSWLSGVFRRVAGTLGVFRGCNRIAKTPLVTI